MSTAKEIILERLELISDDISDEWEVMNRLSMLLRLEESKERCKTEGTLSDDDIAEHFKKKRVDAVRR